MRFNFGINMRSRPVELRTRSQHYTDGPTRRYLNILYIVPHLGFSGWSNSKPEYPYTDIRKTYIYIYLDCNAVVTLI